DHPPEPQRRNAGGVSPPHSAHSGRPISSGGGARPARRPRALRDLSRRHGAPPQVDSLALQVAWRYVQSRPSRLVSSVSLLSIDGIALGVAALVVAMGLLSGYRTEIREKLIGANAEVVVFPMIAGGERDTAAVERRIAQVPPVRATASVIYQTGVASSAATPDGTDAVLKGIDPATERRVSDLEAYLPDAARAVATPHADAPA